MTPQGPGLSSGTRKGEGGRVRNLAYLALYENRPNLRESRICEMRYADNPRGVSSIQCFLKGAWSCLIQNIEVKARHSSFLRLVAVVFVNNEVWEYTEVLHEGFDRSRAR